MDAFKCTLHFSLQWNGLLLSHDDPGRERSRPMFASEFDPDQVL